MNLHLLLPTAARHGMAWWLWPLMWRLSGTEREASGQRRAACYRTLKTRNYIILHRLGGPEGFFLFYSAYACDILRWLATLLPCCDTIPLICLPLLKPLKCQFQKVPTILKCTNMSLYGSRCLLRRYLTP
jgi:hypothetical protein